MSNQTINVTDGAFWTSKQIAQTFVNILKLWLTEEQFAEMVERNQAEEVEGICHSHDYCDANEAMFEAMYVCGVAEWDEQEQMWEQVWKAAGHLMGRN